MSSIRLKVLSIKCYFRTNVCFMEKPSFKPGVWYRGGTGLEFFCARALRFESWARTCRSLSIVLENCTETMIEKLYGWAQPSFIASLAYRPGPLSPSPASFLLKSGNCWWLCNNGTESLGSRAKLGRWPPFNWTHKLPELIRHSFNKNSIPF